MSFNILSILTPQNLLFIFIGSFFGMLIGAMPGMGAMLAVVLMLPFTYSMNPLTAVLMLLSIYQSSSYGGSISSITLGIPGTAGAAATVLDGNVMARNGESGRAMLIAFFASTVGGLAGALILATLTKPLGQFALKLSAPDFCMLGLIGVIAVISLEKKNKIKGLIMIILGLMFSTIGSDEFTGMLRFTFGKYELYDGVNDISFIVGVFAFPEVFNMIDKHLHKRYVTDTSRNRAKLVKGDGKRMIKPVAIGSVLGTVIGIFPGLGIGPASWFSYMLAEKTSKKPEEFGKGSPEGIAAPEAANNACVAGALLPLLALGIPGSSIISVLSTAFLIHGIQLGPALFNTNQELVYSVIYGFFLTVIAMYIIGRLLTPLFSKVITVPNAFLIPAILVLTIVGIYSGDKVSFNLWLALILGIVVFCLKKAGYPQAPMVLAFVLGDIIESNFRRALETSRGSYSIFVQNTCSKVIFVFFMAFVLYPVISEIIRRIKSINKRGE